MKDAKSQHRRNFISLTIIFGLALLMIAVSRKMIPDDAYIYLRLAQNLVHGYGWSYNPGVPSNSATAPFYVLVLGLVEMLGITGSKALIFTYAAGLIGLAWVIYNQLVKVDYALALLCSLAVILDYNIDRSIGMETTVFLLTIALSAKYFEENKMGLSGFYCGLAALGRPEGVALPFLLVFLNYIRSKNLNWKLILFPLISIAPWLIFSQLEFHSIFPHTVTVKAIQSTEGLWYSEDGGWFLGFIKQAPPLFLFMFVAMLGLTSILKLMSKGKTFLSILVGFGIIQVIGYTLLHAPIYYFWYYDVGDFAFVLLIAAGVSNLLQAFGFSSSQDKILKSTLSLTSRRKRAVLLLALLSLLVGPIIDFNLRYHVNTAENLLHAYAGLRHHYRMSNQYKLIAQWLRSRAGSSSIVAADEIGYIGYYSGLKIRDMLGLVENDSAKSLERHQWSWWLTNYKAMPEYIVIHKQQWVGEPTKADVFFKWPKSAFNEFKEYYFPVYSTKNLIVFEFQRIAPPAHS